jgi:YYY domain-containing protein
MIAQFLSWYLVIQVITLLTLPLAWRLLPFLPDRGYGSARILGILLAGYGLWLGYSFGFVRFEAGGAWLSVLLLGAISVAVGRPVLQAWRQTGEAPVSGRYVLVAETVFLVAFLVWALVRAYDPAANHTEKPMDLMFMNSIAASPTYPPQDAWLAGHPISYYYFGYWMLAMLGTLAGQPPEIGYNLGQAAWYGLLLSGSFALGYNLVAAAGKRFGVASGGGLIAALLVGVSANLQAVLEWLYAQGAPVGPIGSLLGSPNFPAEASVTHNWFIDFSWWWWRSSRALADVDLAGNHVEVIDEFPAFSYILGDNHPHVLAMPFALLVISIALNLFLAPARLHRQAVGGGVEPLPVWRRLLEEMPLHWGGWLVAAIAVGSLLFLNTWDFPAYWLLLVLAVFALLLRRMAGEENRLWRGAGGAALAGSVVAATALVLYAPYFLTAQSQASGIVPNLFNPTRLGQFVAMFATALLALIALLIVAWHAIRPNWRQVAASVGLVYGLPILFLLASIVVVTNTDAGKEVLARMPLPEDAPGYVAMIGERWAAQLWTFVLVGGLLGLVAAAAWAQLREAGQGAGESPQTRRTAPETDADLGRRATGAGDPLLFVLFLAGIGLLLVYAPEFVFLRDNFGTRMNTIFKFYYQAWLLFGLAGAYTISVALGTWRGWRSAPAILSILALVLGVTSSIYLVAGAYSKTMGFSGQPTFDATAYLVNGGQNELVALRWIRANTQPDDLVVEGKGASYRADLSRISTMTGRPTLLGWDGHEAQWRGKRYAEMAEGRAEALETIYRGGTAEQLRQHIDAWGIDYIYVGPAERMQYGITPAVEALLRQVTDQVFESGDVRIYRAR